MWRVPTNTWSVSRCYWMQVKPDPTSCETVKSSVMCANIEECATIEGSLNLKSPKWKLVMNSGAVCWNLYEKVSPVWNACVQVCEWTPLGYTRRLCITPLNPTMWTWLSCWWSSEPTFMPETNMIGSQSTTQAQIRPQRTAFSFMRVSSHQNSYFMLFWRLFGRFRSVVIGIWFSAPEAVIQTVTMASLFIQ